MEVNFRHSPPQRVIVHCGLTKTGSTALQIQLFENREWLLASHYYAPRTGIHFDERMPGITRTDGHGFIFSPNGTEQDWADLQAELSAVDLQKYTLILSCENMAQASIENFQAICDRFLGAPVEFHFLIRDFSSWLASQISEFAIGGNTRLIPNDPRLLSNPRHGIIHLVERLRTLELSELDVHFHSYELLKGEDIAIKFLHRTNVKLETEPLRAHTKNRARQHNKFEHNSRFVLLAMRFNQATRDLSFSEYQAEYSKLIEMARQPFYRIASDQSCVLSDKFLENLNQQISFSLHGNFDKSDPFKLLFPKGLVEMPTSSRFDVEELDKINSDLDLLIPRIPLKRRLASVRRSSSLLSLCKNWSIRLFRRTSRATVHALRRTRRGTKLVLWLRQFAWLFRIYGR